jgi:hypothetical protein
MQPEWICLSFLIIWRSLWSFQPVESGRSPNSTAIEQVSEPIKSCVCLGHILPSGQTGVCSQYVQVRTSADWLDLIHFSPEAGRLVARWLTTSGQPMFRAWKRQGDSPLRKLTNGTASLESHWMRPSDHGTHYMDSIIQTVQEIMSGTFINQPRQYQSIEVCRSIECNSFVWSGTQWYLSSQSKSAFCFISTEPAQNFKNHFKSVLVTIQNPPGYLLLSWLEQVEVWDG